MNQEHVYRRRASEPKPRNFPGAEHMSYLLNRADSIRKQIKDLTAELAEMMANPQDSDEGIYTNQDEQRFRAAWAEFLAAGGTTADDLKGFIAGEQIGRGKVTTAKHLRAVANNQRRGLPRYVPRRTGGGPGAA